MDTTTRPGQVILVYVTLATITSGRLRALAAQGASLALVLPSTFNNEVQSALQAELPLLKNSSRVTVFRESADACAGFQHTIADALKQHGKLDAIITEDGEVISRAWSGSDDDRTQMLIYAAFTDIQARRLRRQLADQRGGDFVKAEQA